MPICTVQVVRGVLDGMVLAVGGLPRVGATLSGASAGYSSAVDRGGGAGGSGGAGGAPPTGSTSAIPTTSLTDDAVVGARKFVLAVLAGHSTAPRRLAALFDEWMYLIGGWGWREGGVLGWAGALFLFSFMGSTW